MQTKQKSNSVITHSYADGVLVFNVKDAGEVRLNVADVSAEVRERAMLHGLIQRLSDGAAKSRDEATGLPATSEEKLAGIKALADHYASGSVEWNRKRAAGEGTATGGMLARALGELYPGKDIAAFLKGKTSAERRALEQSAKVKPVLDRMMAERTSGIDAEAMLAGL